MRAHASISHKVESVTEGKAGMIGARPGGAGRQSRIRRGLFAGIAALIIFALPPALRAGEPLLPAGMVSVDGQLYSTLKAAFEAAHPYSKIRIAPGEWYEGGVITADGVVIEAAGAHIIGASVEGKAALVVRADNVEIHDLECSRISVPDRNGACVRLEGRNLALAHVHFHDSEEGLLTGPAPGTVAIWNSRFERLGQAGRAHGIYVGGGRLHISRSRFLAARDQGHEIKSRALENIIEDSVIASADGDDSRLIDISNGGVLVIRRCVLQEGPASVNHDLIGYGLEGMAKGAAHRIRIEDSIIINDAGRPVTFLARPKGAPTPELYGNLFVGDFRDSLRDRRLNRRENDRTAAGLPAAPVIPEPPLLDGGR
ncbi:MAG: hypothetical protein D6757_03660 [Alphaproteobacteria bacterium]|nr:MAG: hypothetical protein D6757_03660 [Alphaproteobacteria bacterium]